MAINEGGNMVLNMEKHKVPSRVKFKKISNEKYKRGLKYIEMLENKFNEKYKDYEKDLNYLKEIKNNLTVNRCMQLTCSLCNKKFTVGGSSTITWPHYHHQKMRTDNGGNWLCDSCFDKNYENMLINYMRNTFKISEVAFICIKQHRHIKGIQESIYVEATVNNNYISFYIGLNDGKK